MTYLLDTNAVIALMKGEATFLQRLRRHRPVDFALPAVVVYELSYGAYKSQHTERNLARIEALQFPVLDFDAEDARCAGRLRAELSASGQPIGPYDVLVAGQALARDLTVVTHNMKKFSRVEGLRVEDWQAG